MNVGKSESPTKMARADFFILRGLLTLLGITDSGTMTRGSGADGWPGCSMAGSSGFELTADVDRLGVQVKLFGVSKKTYEILSANLPVCLQNRK